MINLRIYGVAILVASIGLVIIGSQSAFAGILPPLIDVDVDESAMAGNTTNMTMGSTNQTQSENMTSSMMNKSAG